MNATKIITAICWAVAAFVLLGLALWFFTGSAFGLFTSSFHFGIGGFEILTGSYELAGSYEVPASGIDSLHIDWISGDVTVTPYDGADIKLTEYARRELRGGEQLTVSSSGGTVTVKFRENNKAWRMPSKRLEALVPRELCGNMEKLTLETTSGGIKASGFKAASVVTDTVSGTVSLSDITAQTLHAESTSGSITITSAELADIKLNSTSGLLRLSDAAAKNLSCSTTSGDLDLSGAFDSTDLESISGSIRLNNSATDSKLKSNTTSGSQDFYGSFGTAGLRSVSGKIVLTSTVVPGALQTDTTSGSVVVTVPDEGGITVYHSSSSGSFSNDIPVIMQNNDARFRFSTTSGNVKLLALG